MKFDPIDEFPPICIGVRSQSKLASVPASAVGGLLSNSTVTSSVAKHPF